MTRRIVSGMRPTGGLHLGHLCGVLHNWRALQENGDTCFFFIADWHALTTDYAAPQNLAHQSREMTAAWLAAGINPEQAVIFRQSQVPEHAELFVLLSMICPLPWLTHLPTYKEQKENMQRNLDTHGFLGYPLLQSADIVIYGADTVPVGEDQLPHIEFAREVARRFNRFYGGGEEFVKKRAGVGKKISDEDNLFLQKQKNDYAEKGDKDILQSARQHVESFNLNESDKQILLNDLNYGGAEILREPQPLLTPTPRLPGTDGRKMSKSYNNAIELFDSPKTVSQKLAGMQTDPARVRRTDKGDPTRCPVWRLHEVFSDAPTQTWVEAGCRSADIGCVECKKEIGKNINAVLMPIAERREKITDAQVDDILADGARCAQDEAAQTLTAVREAMKINEVATATTKLSHAQAAN
ncbi:MAG: tryptophan--tRNA ligase [Gammaproteobacteria bacterium WSBS_2016_MAG_OTU1]